jgi:putative DNA primase/helicase
LGIKREALPEGWDAADAELEGFTAENIQAFLDEEINMHGYNMLFSNTPSQHAMIVEEIAQDNDDKAHQEAIAAEKRTQTRELFKGSEFAVIEYRKGFKNGVYWQEPFGEDDVPKHPTLLCSPLIVVAETRDTEQSNWGRLLSWLDNDGHSHNWACPVEMLAATDTAEFRRELVRNGLTIVTNGKARQKLVDYVLSVKPQSQDRVRCVTKTGWHGARYVLSNRVYGKQEGESVIYQGVTNGDFASSGTLSDWQREVAARAVGNSRIVFAISTAFAGALVEMANESGGGFQFTGETSKGKTSTLIDPAASVCGHPDRFAKKWRTTANGLEALCLSRNHSTLMLDDLGQSDAKECGQAAYLIANGQGKARMQKEGGNRPLSTWKVMILSSGEVDIAQHMAEAGKVAKGGQVVRLPSIPADAGAGIFALERLHDQLDGRQFSDTLKAVTREYFGTAGEAFLEKLTVPATLKETTDSIRGGINEIVKLMKITDGAAPEVGRVAARFALVAFAGELATRFGVTGWDKGEALKSSIRCFDDWLNDAGGAMGADDKALFAQVSAFLQAHGASRFPPHDISPDDLQRIQNRAGFSHNNGENVFYWVESGAFKRELCKGFNPTAAAKNLVKAGWLEQGSDRIQQKKRINAIGGKGLWFYVMTFNALGGDL